MCMKNIFIKKGCCCMPQFIDMTGWVMSEHGVPDSKITVIKRAEENGSDGRAMWICICSCGKSHPFIASGKNVRRGNVKSCGCLKVDAMLNARKYSQRKKKGNKYCINLSDNYGDYGYGLCSNTQSKFYFDMEDYEIISKYTWYEYFPDKNSKFSTVATNYIKDNGEHSCIRMHAMLGFKNYDHADRNALNNRKYNLRECTTTENSRNKNIISTNTSGFTGVCWDKANNKWIVQIGVNNKTIYIGRFINKEDAIRARLEAEKQYFGEFAPQRHLFADYNIC